MNANKLSDELEIAQGNNTADELIPETITMLRQQQAREDSLCSMVKEYQDKVDELRAEKEHVTGLNMLLKMQVNGLKSEIETLKKTNEELAEYIWKYESLLRAF